jgi:hypothetical protein
VRAETARMYDNKLRDTLVIEVKDLLTEMKVFERRRPTQANLQRILIIGHRDPLLGGQGRNVAPCDLMCLAAFAADNRLVAQLH